MGEAGESRQTTEAPKRVCAQGGIVTFYYLPEEALVLKHQNYGFPQESGINREISTYPQSDALELKIK